MAMVLAWKLPSMVIGQERRDSPLKKTSDAQAALMFVLLIEKFLAPALLTAVAKRAAAMTAVSQALVVVCMTPPGVDTCLMLLSKGEWGRWSGPIHRS